MARIRTIKPEFWTSAQVMECSRDARLLFIGMWNFADDEGKLPLMENSIRAQIFPGDLDVYSSTARRDLDESSTTIRRMLDELSSNELIKIYVVAGREYIWITGWQHQKIDRPRPSKYPNPPPFDECSTNDRRGLAPDLTLSYPKKDNSSTNSESEIGGEQSVEQTKAVGSLATALPSGALARQPFPDRGKKGVGEKKFPVTSELERAMQAKLRRANGET